MKHIRHICFLITAVLFLSLGSVVAFADYIPPEPEPVAAPRIKLVSQTNYTVGSGETKVLDLSVRNVGTSSAERFLMQAIADTGAPLSLEFLDSSNSVRTFSEGSTKTVKLQVTVDKNAKAGTYTVNLSHFYRNTDGDNLSESDKINIKVEVSAAAPSVLLYDLRSVKQVLTTNDQFTVTGVLENTSRLGLKDLRITLEGLGSDTIFFTGNSDSLYFKEYRALLKTPVSYTFKTSSKVKSGSYPITFKIKYKDYTDTVHENSFVYYANVDTKGTSEKPGYVTISSISAPTGTYEVGQNFTVSLNVNNNGSNTVKNVKVTAVTDTDGAVVPKSTNVVMISELGVNQTKGLSFTFAPTSKSRSQNYVINFKVEYESGLLKDDDTKEILTFEQYAGVNVRNKKADEDEDKDDKEKDKVSKPKIIIESYYTDPQIVEAGQEFSLYAVFRNTHKEKRIDNIKAVLVAPTDTSPEAKGNTFMPVDGSNTFYIDTIAPGGTAAKNFKMYAIPDAQPRTYTMEVNFKYEDAKFNEYEEKEIIGITVKQTTKLETSVVNVPPEVFIGSPFTIDFSIMNQGKSALNNLSVKVEGNFDTSRSFVYFGTMNRYSSGYYDAEITALEPGQHEGKVLITYEDEVGAVKEVTKEFMVNVMDMGGGGEGMMGPDGMMIGPDGMPIGPDGMPMGPDGMPGMPGEGFDFFSPIMWTVYAVIVVGGGVVTFIIIRKKIKKKKQFELDE